MVQLRRYLFFFFFENAKNLGQTTLNGEKKEDGLNDYVSILTNLEFGTKPY